MPDPRDGRQDDDGQTTNDEGDGGKETIPMVVVAGVAAFIGGVVGSAVGGALF